MKNILKPLLPDIVMKPVLIPKLLKCPEYNIYVFYPILQKRCVYETQEIIHFFLSESIQ